MLFYVFYYLLSAVLMFQGTQAIGESREPMGVIPEQVRSGAEGRRTWGGVLAGVGAFLVVMGLISHAQAGLFPVLRVLQVLGLAAMGGYGLWTIFAAKKVVYLGKPSAPSHH